jgi:isoquinoline 1-oxidoreductase beta subunit
VWDEKTYGNPEFFTLHTVASMATRGYFKPMRIAGAQARRVLLNAAAEKWRVPVGERRPSRAWSCIASGRRLSYGDIAGSPRLRPSCPGSRRRTSPPARFRYIGADLRASSCPKVTGAANTASMSGAGHAYAAGCTCPIRARPGGGE